MSLAGCVQSTLPVTNTSESPQAQLETKVKSFYDKKREIEINSERAKVDHLKNDIYSMMSQLADMNSAKLKEIQLQNEALAAKAEAEKAAAQQEPSYPIGVIETPEVKQTIVEQKNDAVVVDATNWALLQPDSPIQPVIDWKLEDNQNAVLLSLEKGKGYEVIYAKTKNGDNSYKGKQNGSHKITLPYMSNDFIDIEIKDAKSRKYHYRFVATPNQQQLKTPDLKQSPEVVKVDDKTLTVAQPVEPVLSDTAGTAKGYVFVFKSGQYLSDALNKFVKESFNWTLAWNRANDIQTNTELSQTSQDIGSFAAWLGMTANIKVLLDYQTQQMLVTDK